MFDKNLIRERWQIPQDDYLAKIKNDWFSKNQKIIPVDNCIDILDKWFKSTKLNTLHNWDKMPHIDITMGCAHYIESFIIGQGGIDNFQVLDDEYAYYSFLGKWGTPLNELKPNLPLIITLPHWKWGGLRPEWNDVLKICEERNIEIHIDMAWLTLSKGIEIDLGHPNIRSIGLGLSKFGAQWNRVGLRYSKQRRMDSITIFNEFYIKFVNDNLYSCGAYIAQNIERDYSWNTYGDLNNQICEHFGYEPTNLIHGVKDKSNDKVLCITELLNLGTGQTPHKK